MEKIVQTFKSFEEADAADAAYYRALTPARRLDILLDLVDQGRPQDETKRRLERVYRIVELARS
jgi:hypothetical protein